MTKDCFIEPVRARHTRELQRVITETSLLTVGGTVMFLTVNHPYDYVDAETHMQNMERLWRHVRDLSLSKEKKTLHCCLKNIFIFISVVKKSHEPCDPLLL